VIISSPSTKEKKRKKKEGKKKKKRLPVSAKAKTKKCVPAMPNQTGLNNVNLAWR
jgi:hypothetical protein